MSGAQDAEDVLRSAAVECAAHFEAGRSPGGQTDLSACCEQPPHRSGGQPHASGRLRRSPPPPRACTHARCSTAVLRHVEQRLRDSLGELASVRAAEEARLQQRQQRVKEWFQDQVRASSG